MGWADAFFSSSASPAGSNATSIPAIESAPSASSACNLYRIEPAIDYVGGDIGTDPVAALNLEACCAVCEHTRRCNAFTFVAVSRDCWLKLHRRRARPVTQPTTLVSGHRGRLKPLTFGGIGAFGETAQRPQPRMQRQLPARLFGSLSGGSGGFTGTRPTTYALHARSLAGGGAFASRFVRGGGSSGGDALRALQERQAEQLLARAAQLWRAVARGCAGPPPFRLSLSAQAGTSSRTVLRSGAAAADDDVPADVATTVWLQWPARSQRATGTARPSAGVNTSVAGLKPPSEIGDVVEIGDPHTCRDSWERPAVMLGGEQGNEPDGSNEVAGATTAADGAVEARSFARSSSSSSEGSGRGGVDRSSAQRRAAVIIPSGKNVAPHLLARLTTRTSEGHAMHHRPVALPTANTLSARTLPRPFSFLWARLLPGSPVLHQALLSEARGYGRALVLSTAEPCGHLRAPVADATGESRAAGGIVGAAAEASAAAAAAADDAEHSANDDEHEREQFGPDAAGTREAISIAAVRHQAAVARAQSERSFDQCFRTLAPLLASSAVMPAAGAREASVAHGCGAEWARRWWPGGAWEGERVHAHAPSLAHDSSTSEASRPRFGCIAGSDGSSSARPLWYGFVKRRVLFLALSSAHSLAHTDEQHTELRRAARAARASGASFVVAYGERPSNVTSDASLRDLLAGMGADLYLCASASSSAATAPERSSVVASSLRESDERRLPRSQRGGKGSSSKMTAVVSLDGLPEDAYVRLSIADNRTALLVERVRALDGRVLDSFGVLAEPKKRVGKF